MDSSWPSVRPTAGERTDGVLQPSLQPHVLSSHAVPVDETTGLCASRPRGLGAPRNQVSSLGETVPLFLNPGEELGWRVWPRFLSLKLCLIRFI